MDIKLDKFCLKGIQNYFFSFDHGRDPNTHSYCVTHTDSAHIHNYMPCLWLLIFFCLGCFPPLDMVQTLTHIFVVKNLNGTHIPPKNLISLRKDLRGGLSPISWSLSSTRFVLGARSLFCSLPRGIGLETHFYCEKHTYGTKDPP